MLEKGKTNILPEYYRKLGSIKGNGCHTGVSYQENNCERRYGPERGGEEAGVSAAHEGRSPGRFR
jgi:hypothetical protein